MNKISKDEKRKTKEIKVVDNFKNNKKKVKINYINKSVLKKKFKNAISFTNSDYVMENGIIRLRDGHYANVYSVDAIDLSLTSNNQKNIFFQQLKYLYQIKDLNLRIYKLDDKIDLNSNKDYYRKLIEKFYDDESKVEFLNERLERLEILEQKN